MNYLLSAVFVSILFIANVGMTLQASDDISSLTNSGSEVIHYSDAELAQMLAPIALYPDSLLTHILIASTYPLEVVEAQRWAEQQKHLNKEDMAVSLESKTWDPSVKALVPFDKVLNRLSLDLTWTNTLGNVFLLDEERVLSAIQALRLDAKNSGNLEQIDKMEVSYDESNIILTPSEPEIIYVPVYDSRSIYGNWRWSNNPPIYWAYPTPYYRSFYWSTPVYISVNYYFSAFHWHNRHIVTINHRNTRHYRPRNKIVYQQHTKRWHHKPSHRKGVSYVNRGMHKKYYGSQGPKYRNKLVHQQGSVHLNKKSAKLLRTDEQYKKHYTKLKNSNTDKSKRKYTQNKMDKSYDIKSNYSAKNDGGKRKVSKNANHRMARPQNEINNKKRASKYVTATGSNSKATSFNKHRTNIKETHRAASLQKPSKRVDNKPKYQANENTNKRKVTKTEQRSLNSKPVRYASKDQNKTSKMRKNRDE
jgi:hypothetical protein